MNKLQARKIQKYEPPSRKGNLYYVRLKTPVGRLYKLGFTSLGSVEERLAFNGNGDEKLIDKVIVFVHLDDAFDVECRLHEIFEDQIAFSRYDSIPEMPLHQNGQSELYRRDILKLDKDFQGIEGDLRKRGASEEEIRQAVERQEAFEKKVRFIFLPVLWLPLKVLAGMLWLIEKTFAVKAFKDAEQHRQELKSILKRINDVKAATSDIRRLERQKIIKSFFQNQSDIEKKNRHRLVVALEVASFIHAVEYVAAVHPLDLNTIASYENSWRWESLSRSGSVKWSTELISRFEERLDWICLTDNGALPWSTHILEKFESRWHWRSLSESTHLPWSSDLIKRFQQRWNWEELSANESIPWSDEIIARFQHYLHWDNISSNESIPWTVAMLKGYQNRLNWDRLSHNSSMPFTQELVEFFRQKWNWQNLCTNQSLPITQDFMERYREVLSWPSISCRKDLPWSLELLKRYEEHWDWVKLAENDELPWTLELIESFNDRWHTKSKEGKGAGLAGNNPLLCSVSMIRQYSGSMDWVALAQNPAVPWSAELIAEYKNKLPWNLLSLSTTIPWTVDLIERFEDSWNWSDYQSCLSSNESLPWSAELIERFYDRWDFSWLSSNKSLPWSLELIERYANQWSWARLADNPAMRDPSGALKYLPNLTSSDVGVVMRTARNQQYKFVNSS